MKKRGGKISIVTGASSGLGREIAKLLSERGHRVYVIARRKKELIELKKECSKNKGEIKILDGDLTDSKFREKIISNVLKEEKRIDYLINNAGFGKLIEFEEMELKDIENMFALNAIAGPDLIRLALPSMKKAGKGRIINVASVVSFVPPAYFSIYNGTKAAIHNFSRSLSYDLRGSGVSISVLFPARMDTPFWTVAFKCKHLTEDEQNVCIQNWTKGSTKSLKVAEYLVRHLDSKRLIFLPGLLPKFYYYIVKNIPFLGNFVTKNFIGPKTKKMLKGKDIKNES
jgi:short-subunit dehydrogenase